jgi:hypothetical protein
MRDVELGHHQGDCSFETILRRYQLDDPVLRKIAEITPKPAWTTNATTPPKHPAWTSRCVAFDEGDDQHTLSM